MTDTVTETIDTNPLNDSVAEAAESAKTPSIHRRLDKGKFVRVVKEYTRPGRPAFAALAREFGAMLGISITLAEPIKCPRCDKSFVPWSKAQTHCSAECSNFDRQDRYRANVKKRKATTQE